MLSASDRSGHAENTAAPDRANRRPACSMTPATEASTSNAPPRSADQATRSPCSDPESGGSNEEPGSPSASGARASGPAMTERSRARSPTLRAIGPPTEVVSHWFGLGHSGTRPNEGRSPTTPQNDAGLRSEPPMSDPSASGTIPDASAAAAPPLDPPAERDGSTGLRVTPKTVLNVWDPAANSGTLVLPTNTAPALRTRSTRRSSWSATESAKIGEP